MHLSISFFSVSAFVSFIFCNFATSNIGGEGIRNIDTDTLLKLLSQELLMETSDGIRLTPLYDEMKQRAGVTDRTEGTDVPKNDTINAQTLSDVLGISVITIKHDLYVLRDMNLIKYVGSNKTGHWELLRE